MLLESGVSYPLYKNIFINLDYFETILFVKRSSFLDLKNLGMIFCLDNHELADFEEEELSSDLVKSPISLVHESALKRNLVSWVFLNAIYIWEKNGLAFW